MGDPVIEALEAFKGTITASLEEHDFCFKCECHGYECECVKDIDNTISWYKKSKEHK